MRKDLLLFCAGGCEDIVYKQVIDILKPIDSSVYISRDLQSRHDYGEIVINGHRIYKGAGGIGRLRLTTTASPIDIFRIPTVQAVLVHIVSSYQVEQSKVSTLERISQLLKFANWTYILQCYSTMAQVQELSERNSSPKVRFAVRCLREGSHEFNDLDLSLHIVECLESIHPTWELCTKAPNYEIVCVILNEVVCFGINVIPSQSVATNVLRKESDFTPNSPVRVDQLRPSTSALLMSLCELEIGDVVVDLMTGSGDTILSACGSCEHQRPAPGIVTVGGSSGPPECGAKIRNILDGVLWSARNLPIRDASVNAVIVDIPFGATPKLLPRHHRARIPQIVEEVARILVPCHGYVLFLVQSAQHLIACIDSHYFFLSTWRGLNIEGIVYSTVIAKRTCKAFSASRVSRSSPLSIDDEADSPAHKKRKFNYVEVKDTKD